MSHRISGPNQRERYTGPLTFIGEDLQALVAQINTAIAALEPQVTRWTPRIVGTTLGGFGTYSFQHAWCVKQHDLITLFGTIVWSAHTGTGNMRIAGLPYVATESEALTFRGVGAASCSNLTFTQQLALQIVAGENEIRLNSITTGASAAETAMDTAASLSFSLQYLTD